MRAPTFDKVLIANRGEIAVRVIRACREEGLAAVAVYSEPDRTAPHVLSADEAVPIGPAPAAESYLDIERILEAARRTGAGAVHPGYGFLAENAGFARAVEEAGLTFIGPPAAAIEAMGDKTEARARMEAAGVPVVPGGRPVADADAARRESERIGFPVMLKAAAGGGGKGMRIARDAAGLASALEGAIREARGAFGDGRVYLERFLDGPRHIEIQVLADAGGRTLHLGERECSIQRRHQKLIEESPSPAVDAEIRARMGEVAVRAAEAVGYVGAGTVEFLFHDGTFYFLEMNTRIQVEHPVTELITGIDLVREQLRIARGEPVLGGGDPPAPSGHAIECRVSAEDPYRDFLPSSGRIEALRAPAGPGVRWDSGIEKGMEVGLHYDPLLAKLVVHAGRREAAIRRMDAALSSLAIAGVATTVPFHTAVMREPDFARGEYDIRYVERHPELLSPAAPAAWRDALVAAAALLEESSRRDGASPAAGPGRLALRGAPLSAWRRAGLE